MRTSEILNKAADLIQEHGWTQGESGWDWDFSGAPLCLEGGIMAAQGLSWDSLYEAGSYHTFLACPSFVAVEGYLGERPWLWNDKFDRTAEEVIEVLRACALIEQAKEDSSVEVPAEALEVTW